MPITVVSWPGFAIAVAAALVLAIVIAACVALPVRLLARRRGWALSSVSRVRRPFRLLLVVIGLWNAVDLTFPLRTWITSLDHVFLILTIAGAAGLVAGIVSFGLGGILVRYPTDVADNRVARRVHTQVLILRRIIVVIIVVIAVGAILLSFPGVKALGTSLLASAGLLSVIAGLAAQSTLANVFAGMQLAFSDALRIDDVVVVEEEWGTIEQITLTYVVVHIWDDRRLVLPSTYFTVTPFENWTRNSSQLLGSVEMDLDWRVSPTQLREQLGRILDDAPLWDRRAQVLQVTDAIGGWVHIRILVTAKDAPTLFDLRCYVRERIIDFIQSEQSFAMPRQRVQLVEDQPRDELVGAGRAGVGRADASRSALDSAAPSRSGPHTGGVFTGSPDAEARAQNLRTSPVEVPVPAE